MRYLCVRGQYFVLENETGDTYPKAILSWNKIKGDFILGHPRSNDYLWPGYSRRATYFDILYENSPKFSLGYIKRNLFMQYALLFFIGRVIRSNFLINNLCRYMRNMFLTDLKVFMNVRILSRGFHSCNDHY